jgi:hypothetical protein
MTNALNDSGQFATLPAPQCGLFNAYSSTGVAFIPKNGDRVQIAGVVYAIPATGVLAANTGVYVAGIAGQNLVANATYLVCVFNNGGTLTLDFLSTVSHAVDTTTGNVGVEIKTGDNSRTVVGLIRTNGSAQFSDSTAARFTLSWFNRQEKITSFGGSNQSTASTVLVNTGGACTCINWGDNAPNAIFIGQGATTGVNVEIEIGIDGATAFGAVTFCYGTPAAGGGFPFTIGGYGPASEGSHTYGAYAATSSGTASILNWEINVVVRG